MIASGLLTGAVVIGGLSLRSLFNQSGLSKNIGDVIETSGLCLDEPDTPSISSNNNNNKSFDWNNQRYYDKQSNYYGTDDTPSLLPIPKNATIMRKNNSSSKSFKDIGEFDVGDCIEDSEYINSRDKEQSKSIPARLANFIWNFTTKPNPNRCISVKQMIINPLINPQNSETWPLSKNKIVGKIYMRSTFSNVVILTACADTGKYCENCEKDRHYIYRTKCNIVEQKYQMHVEYSNINCSQCNENKLCRIVVYVSFLIFVSSGDLSEYELYVNIDNNTKIISDNEKRTTVMRVLSPRTSIEDIIDKCKHYIENNVIYDNNIGACVEHIYANINRS